MQPMESGEEKHCLECGGQLIGNGIYIGDLFNIDPKQTAICKKCAVRLGNMAKRLSNKIKKVIN